ncbi:MAG: hypothetical protein WEB87_03665, partial [Bacteriovoracaceae bacterium]
MRGVPLFIAFFLSAGLSSSAWSFPDVSYEKRERYLKIVGVAYPGYVAFSGFKLRRHGLFAGNIIQTQWQRSSG